MRTLTLLAVVAVVGLAVATPASSQAAFCDGNVIEVGVGNETIYVDDRTDDPNAPPGSGFIFGPGGTWIYLESNGEEGLQRGGDTGVPGGADPCVDSLNPDQIIF